MKSLTPRQREIFDFIKKYLKEKGYPPTIREVAAHFSISIKGAYDHVKTLEKKEYIRCDLNRSRAIEILDKQDEESLVSIPMLGNVAAGKPLFSEENFERMIQFPAAKLKKGKYFALSVKGDSMLNAGIIDGDTAVFIHKSQADNGDIVVARIDDEAVTLKRFYKEKNRIKLKAENPVYPPIYTRNVRILGKLQFILRDYK